MKKIFNFLHSVPGVGIVTLLLLLIPFIAMKTGNGIDWSASDFLIVGVLIFGAGLSYVWASRQEGSLLYKVAVGWTILSTLLLIWANLAVGLVGSGPNAVNLMYIAVVAIVVVGGAVTRFKAVGLDRVTLAGAATLLLVAVIALASGVAQKTGASWEEVILVNVFFAALFASSSLLFRTVVVRQRASH